MFHSTCSFLYITNLIFSLHTNMTVSIRDEVRSGGLGSMISIGTVLCLQSQAPILAKSGNDW